MKLSDIATLYGALPQAIALRKTLSDNATNTIWLKNIKASAVPLLFASVAPNAQQVFVFILSDADEAGYFYNDLAQIMGKEQVMFFPSSYRRAVKYGQHDPASEILRTEVLATLSAKESSDALNKQPLFIVSYPEAIAEMVVSKQLISDKVVKVAVSQVIDLVELRKRL